MTPISVQGMEYSPERRLRDRMTRFLLALLLSATGGAALAQTTGAVNPGSAPAQPSVSADVPPGGCMPIGLTTSGEIVFPIQCKEFIELHRGKDVEQRPAAMEQKPAAVVEQKPAVVEEKPAAVEEKPAALEEKPAGKQSEAVAPENSQPADKPPEAVPLPKRPERKLREHASLSGCQHYRTYDPAAGTYRGYDGRVRPCR
jgi:outer membrane biosynthesis protein TonB